MDLPQRLESKGVEFAAAPPKKPNIFTTILSWVVPPLIFILVLQFFARRSMGGGGAQGALNFTKSKAKVYVPDEQSRVTFADVAGVDEAKDELNEIVDFQKHLSVIPISEHEFPKGSCWLVLRVRVKPCSLRQWLVRRVFLSSSSVVLNL